MPTTPVRRAATAAALALFAGVAGTASAAAVEFRWKDLDLGTAAGKAEFDRRVNVAARQMCSTSVMTGTRIDRSQDECIAGIRAEIVEKVAARTSHSPASLASADPEKAR